MNSLTALADPTRLHIVEMLAAHEMSAGDIARRFEMSGPAVSQHLKVLKQARLVSVRAEAQKRIYALNDEGFSELEQWLANIRRFWNPRLDALERELNAAAKKDRKK
jgi:DNA-binding transcriptional ArsR family regulator